MGDPYEILGVGREATTSEIDRAYQEKLTEARRLGGVKLAQKIDAAYTILRDSRRRTSYDRYGHVEPLAREPWSPPVAAPLRAWSPSGGTARRAAKARPLRSSKRGASRFAIVVALAAAVGGGAYLHAHLSHSADASSTGAQHVRVICPPAHGHKGYRYVVDVGTANVHCSNGATPSTHVIHASGR